MKALYVLRLALRCNLAPPRLPEIVVVAFADITPHFFKIAFAKGARGTRAKALSLPTDNGDRECNVIR